MLCFELFEDNDAFIKWFGDSKVVDADGKPLRVYHGTPEDFEAFKKTRRSKTNAFNRDKYIGIFFSDNPEAADFYSGFPGKHAPKTIPVFLSLQNPLIIDYGGERKSPNKMIELSQEAKRNGNDGLIIRNIRDTPTLKSETLYIAFAPWQIKSAVGNNGNWNKFDRRITQ